MLCIRCFISQVFSSNVYALEDMKTSDVWLIDAGYSEELMKYLSDSRNLRGIFLTHAHFDHISGLNQILDAYPNIKIYTHPLSTDYLSDPEKNLSLFHENPMCYTGKIIPVKEGCQVQLNRITKIFIIETPGHHPTCLTFRYNDYLFTGDAYIPGVKVVANLPEGDKLIAKQTEKKIKNILSYGLKIYPGHTINNKK